MPKKFILFFLLLSSFSLGACVNREQADARLKKGCTAAIEAFLTDGYSIKEVKSASYSEVPDRLDGDRKVSLTISESDGWYESERTYSCNFVEDFGIFKNKKKILAIANNSCSSFIWWINNFKSRFCCSTIYIYNFLK